MKTTEYTTLTHNNKEYFFGQKQRLEILRNCGKLKEFSNTLSLFPDGATSIANYYNLMNVTEVKIRYTGNPPRHLFQIIFPETWTEKFYQILCEKSDSIEFANYIKDKIFYTLLPEEILNCIETCLTAKSQIIRKCWKKICQILNSISPYPYTTLIKSPIHNFGFIAEFATRSKSSITFKYSAPPAELFYCFNPKFPVLVSRIFVYAAMQPVQTPAIFNHCVYNLLHIYSQSLNVLQKVNCNERSMIPPIYQVNYNPKAGYSDISKPRTEQILRTALELIRIIEQSSTFKLLADKRTLKIFNSIKSKIHRVQKVTFKELRHIDI